MGDGMGQDFGNALERRRADKGLSREGLAKRIAYTYQYVWEQENGRKPPTRRFAEACDRRGRDRWWFPDARHGRSVGRRCSGQCDARPRD